MKFKVFNHSDGWLDCIFSQSTDDLCELVKNEQVGRAIEEARNRIDKEPDSN